MREGRSQGEGGHKQVCSVPEPGVAPRALYSSRAEELEAPEKLGPCPAALSGLSFLLCHGEERLVCPFPSPDAGRGLGASRSPQGNICTFQTHVVSGGGECQAPARHPPPLRWPPCWKQGLGGNGLQRGHCRGYVTHSSRASSCLLPLAGRDSMLAGERVPPSPSKAQDSVLFPPPRGSWKHSLGWPVLSLEALPALGGNRFSSAQRGGPPTHPLRSQAQAKGERLQC